jgi:hypothetical protein
MVVYLENTFILFLESDDAYLDVPQANDVPIVDVELYRFHKTQVNVEICETFHLVWLTLKSIFAHQCIIPICFDVIKHLLDIAIFYFCNPQTLYLRQK